MQKVIGFVFGKAAPWLLWVRGGGRGEQEVPGAGERWGHGPGPERGEVDGRERSPVGRAQGWVRSRGAG